MGSDRERRHESASNSNFNPRSRMGSDEGAHDHQRNHNHFNPRSPHGERQEIYTIYHALGLFQSTLPAWGATTVGSTSTPVFSISIHAPRMGSDLDDGLEPEWLEVFQSTLPAWGATLR